MEIIDDEGFTVIYKGSLSANFRRFNIAIYADLPCKPEDIARFLRIYADKLEAGKEIEIEHDEYKMDH